MRRQVVLLVALAAVAACALTSEARRSDPPAPKKDKANPVMKAHDDRLKSLFYPGAEVVETQWHQASDRIKLRLLDTPDPIAKVATWYGQQLTGRDLEFGAWESFLSGADLKTFTLGGATDASEYGIGEKEVKRPVTVQTLVQTKPGHSLTVVLTRTAAEKRTVISLTYTVLEGLETYFEKKK